LAVVDPRGMSLRFEKVRARLLLHWLSHWPIGAPVAQNDPCGGAEKWFSLGSCIWVWSRYEADFFRMCEGYLDLALVRISG